MKKIRKNRFIIALFMTLGSLILFLNYLKANAYEDAQSQYDSVKKALQDNNSNLSGIEKDINEYNYDIASLDEQVTQYAIKLSDIQTKVDDVNKKIENQQNALQEASQKYTSAQGVYATRLRLIYENGIPSVIDVFFSSKGISDFFSKINVINSLLDYDKTLTSNMQSQKEYVDYIKKDMNVQKVQLDQLQYDLSKSKEALDGAVSAKAAKVSALNNDKTNLKAKQELLKEQEKAAKEKVNDEWAKLAAAGTTYSGNFTGTFTWPVPGHYNITAMFDDRDYPPITGFHHTGTDVGVAIGTTVVAMTDGNVVRAGYNSGGYGNYIIIDHGNTNGYTYFTLYGHLSAFLVSKGDNVKKGQKIALSGNTGNSTGPHIHIEVDRTKNGSTWSEDTMTYFSAGEAAFTYASNSGTISYPFGNTSKYQFSSEIKRSYNLY